MKKILCPSIMCADFSNLKQEIEALDNANVDIFHCDIMDGSFVPNITMGLMDIKAIRKHTKKMIDCHLMVEKPSEKVKWFIEAGVDLIYIHPESERYVIKTLMYIKEQGKKSGIAINPDTSIYSIEELLYFCDYVMVMTVNPGFSGQKFIESIDLKIKKLIELKNKFKFKIIIDGACSSEVIKKYSYIGCDGFILGTSSLFGGDKNYIDKITFLQEL